MTYLKILAVVAIAAIGYCQDYQRPPISLQGVISHEVPYRLEYYHHNAPERETLSNPATVQKFLDLVPPIPQLFGEGDVGPYNNLVIRKNIPVNPAPVTEAVHDIPPPSNKPAHFPPQQLTQPVFNQQSIHLDQPVHYHQIQIAPKEQLYRTESNLQHHGSYAEYYVHPKYEFMYKVDDPHTGDKKYQHESRDGDVVKGVYSLQEPDGSIRTVKYGADKHTGFTAEVSHQGHSTHEGHHYHLQ